MKINELFTEFKVFVIRCYSYLKIIRTIPHSGKYAALALLLMIFFTFITFPFEHLIKKKLYENEGKGYRTVSIRNLNFSIIRESSADDIDIVFNDGNELTCSSLIMNISVNPYRLFISRRILADFQLDGLRLTSISSEIQLNLNGNTDLIIDKVKNIPVSGNMKLILSDGNIKISNLTIPGPMGPFQISPDTVNIQNGIAEIDIINGIARIRNFRLSGTDLNCTISGTIDISEKADNSKLDLSINIDPESVALEQYRDMINLITKNNPLILTVKGTVKRPDVKLASAGKPE